MRLLAVILLVANAMFFTWQLNEQIQERIARARRTLPSPPNTPRLTLLDELAVRPALRQPPNPAPAASPVAGAPLPRVDAGAPPAAVPDAASLAATGADAAPAAVAGALAAEPAAASPAVGDGMVAPLPVARAPSGICVRVGPYAKTADYAPLLAWLQPRAVDVSVTTTELAQRKRFWIYLEPHSIEEAQTNLRDLARRGVHDYLLIRRAGVENAISLGVFSSQDAVNRRLSEIEKQGYRPIVVPRDETLHQHFVTAQLAVGSGRPDDFPVALMDGQKLQQLECPQAAQR